MSEEPVREQIEQKAGAHAWMVGIGAACLLVAIAMAVLGRVSGSTVVKVGDTTTTKSWPTEALITSVLAVGAVLVIVGFLWARITSIKVAGAEIGLNDTEKAKVADQLKEKVPQSAGTDEAAKAAVGVVTALTAQKASGTALTDIEISKVVDEHTKELQSAVEAV